MSNQSPELPIPTLEAINALSNKEADKLVGLIREETGAEAVSIVEKTLDIQIQSNLNRAALKEELIRALTRRQVQALLENEAANDDLENAAAA